MTTRFPKEFKLRWVKDYIYHAQAYLRFGPGPTDREPTQDDREAANILHDKFRELTKEN